MTQEASNTPPYSFSLRGSDQAVCAAGVALALIMMLASWIYHGGPRGELIDIEREPRRPIPFELDINTADWPEWTVLPGIGETLARRIVQSRDDEGRFRSIDDLLRVRGIGPRTLERIRPYLVQREKDGAPLMNADER